MRVGKGVVEARGAVDVVTDVTPRVLVEVAIEAKLELVSEVLVAAEPGVDMQGQTVVVA